MFVSKHKCTKLKAVSGYKQAGVKKKRKILSDPLFLTYFCIMKFNKNTLGFLYNRYVIVGAILGSMIFLFGPNNIKVQHRLNKKLEKVEAEKQFYLREIEKNRKISNDLLTNEDNLERFAREQYWMKRDNEDVFLVIREGAETKTRKK
jgi:cell division protein FtsB